MGTMMGLTIHGFIEGNPEKFIAPFDQDGNFCGHENPQLGADGKNMEEYPYLYMPNLDTKGAKEILNTGICVKECPAPEKQYGE